MGVDGFLLGHFCEGFELEDESVAYPLCVDGVFVGYSGDSSADVVGEGCVASTPSRFQRTVDICIQICVVSASSHVYRFNLEA